MAGSGSIWRRALTVGLVAGVAVLYLATVGLVLAFAERSFVTGVTSFGRVILAIPPLAAGFVIGSRAGSVNARLAAGLLAGAISGALLAVSLLFASAVDIRGVLIRVSAPLISFVAWDQDAVTGAGINLALAVGLGLVGAALRIAPRSVRMPVLAAIIGVVVMSLLERFLRPRLTELDFTDVARFLYQGGGLTVPAALITFVLVAAIAVAWSPVRSRVQRAAAGTDAGQRSTIRAVLIVLLIGALLYLPEVVGTFFSQVLVSVGLYVLLGLGLNIVVGYAGLLDLGYVAFFAVGSYLTALLTSPLSSLGLGLPFWVALPIVIVGAAVTGLLIGAPVLRLRGDYLAIVTLGFGEIARLLFLSDALKPWLGGTQGILAIPDMFGVPRIELPILGVISGPELTYYPLVLFCILAIFIAHRLKYSRTGRAWNAMREDEDVAEATGISTVNYKLLAFAMGAGIGCLGGAVFATHLESVFPGTFNIIVSITVLSIVILGGMGSIPGVVLGSLALIGLPELLREFAEFKLLVYGGVLMVMMILRPEGLLPDRARQLELHEADEEETGDDDSLAPSAPRAAEPTPEGLT
ncbi:MAG TPA: leucine/isoleucine/valine transporter permease subunit [Candidatus Dormibacteraeota bacterium]|nr:leucine/isoleucine/valine transporter permease subunit [Candidatus Dormibacteraeota bacterium]